MIPTVNRFCSGFVTPDPPGVTLQAINPNWQLKTLPSMTFTPINDSGFMSNGKLKKAVTESSQFIFLLTYCKFTKLILYGDVDRIDGGVNRPPRRLPHLMAAIQIGGGGVLRFVPHDLQHLDALQQLKHLPFQGEHSSFIALPLRNRDRRASYRGLPPPKRQLP
jgi:hypothetical protein